MAPSVVLVTGVSRYLGARVAAALATEPGVRRVLGVDTARPGAVPDPFGRIEYVHADIRHPLLARVLTDAGVDTVIHTGAGGADEPTARPGDVTGTLQLLAACQAAPGVRRMVVRSTTTVYGQGPGRPALATEAEPDPEVPPRHPHARAMADVEAHLRGFARHRPDVAVTVLRLAALLGPRVDTPLARFFGRPVVPTPFGYDPRLQFLHERDGAEAFRLAVLRREPLGGAAPPDGDHLTLNVAGTGVLLMSQAIRRAGRLPLPLPSLPCGAAVGGSPVRWRAGPLRFAPPTFGAVVDTARLRDTFGYTPRFTTVEAFDDFVRTRLRPGVADRKRLRRAERAVRGLLGAG